MNLGKGSISGLCTSFRNFLWVWDYFPNKQTNKLPLRCKYEAFRLDFGPGTWGPSHDLYACIKLGPRGGAWAFYKEWIDPGKPRWGLLVLRININLLGISWESLTSSLVFYGSVGSMGLLSVAQGSWPLNDLNQCLVAGGGVGNVWNGLK